jgi:hypothetical protein
VHSLYTIQLHGPLDTSFTFVVEGAACPGPNFSKRITGPGQGDGNRALRLELDAAS